MQATYIPPLTLPDPSLSRPSPGLQPGLPPHTHTHTRPGCWPACTDRLPTPHSGAFLEGYVQQFLYTFRYFCSPHDFLHFLLDRISSTLSRYPRVQGKDSGGERGADGPGAATDAHGGEKQGGAKKVGPPWTRGCTRDPKGLSRQAGSAQEGVVGSAGRALALSELACPCPQTPAQA